MAVVIGELCDTEDQPPHQDGSKVIRRPCGPSRIQRAGPNLSVLLTSVLVTKAGLCLESLVIIAMGIPVSLLLPLQEMVPSDHCTLGASQAEGHAHILGSPCS